MSLINFAYMCLCIGTYLYYYTTGAPFPESLRSLNTWICWGFLAWGGFHAGRVIVDCVMLSAQNQMQPEHVRNGILLALTSYLPTVLMSVFMLREGFMEP